MFTASYSLYRFKSKRTLASQHGRRRDRHEYEGLENLEQEEAENFEHYRFTPEEAAAKRARHFEDMEQNIAAAYKLRAQEEESQATEKALELSGMIAKARLWSTNYQVLEFDAAHGTRDYDDMVLAKLDQDDFQLLEQLSQLDILKLEAGHFCFDMRDRLWRYALCHQLSTKDVQYAHLFDTQDNDRIENLSFKLADITNAALNAVTLSFVNQDELAFDAMPKVLTNRVIAHNPVADALGFFEALARPSGFLVSGLSQAFIFKPWQLGGAYHLVQRYVNWLNNRHT